MKACSAYPTNPLLTPTDALLFCRLPPAFYPLSFWHRPTLSLASSTGLNRTSGRDETDQKSPAADPALRDRNFPTGDGEHGRKRLVAKLAIRPRNEILILRLVLRLTDGVSRRAKKGKEGSRKKGGF